MKNQIGVWQFMYEPRDVRDKKVHPVVFPIAMAKRVIEQFTHKRELVIDPFVGSSTTLVAAQKTIKETVKQAIREEIDEHKEEFKEIIKQQLSSKRMKNNIALAFLDTIVNCAKSTYKMPIEVKFNEAN